MFLFFIFLFLVSEFVAVLGGNVSASELDVLRSFYDATSGDSWNYFEPFSLYGSPWVFDNSSNPCIDLWQGIACDVNCSHSDNCSVIAISLYNRSLAGTIIPQLSELSALEIFDVQDNELVGNIPTDICSFNSLIYLNLGYNELDGQIPTCIGDLSSMDTLGIQGNQLSGLVPSSFCSLSVLKACSIYSNALSGWLPACPPLNIEYFDAFQNHFEGPLPDYLGRVSLLDLEYNHFSQSIPMLLCNATRLQQLQLMWNSITGSLPACFGDLSSLRHIDMNENLLEGVVPLLGGSVLWEVILSHNSFSGTLDVFCTIPVLNVLSLEVNQFSGSLPSCLFDSTTDLASISAASNNLHGELPALIGNCSRLFYFDMAHNQLEGTVPVDILKVSTLQMLHLADNLLSGSLPLAFPSCLQYLNVSRNQFSGSLSIVPTATPVLGTYSVCILYLDLSYNKYQSSIPSDLGTLLYSEQFVVRQNFLTGVIPSSVGLMMALVLLDLSSNMLVGSLPTHVQDMRLLETLLVGDNRLTGTMEGVFSSSKQPLLSVIDVSFNNIGGSLPRDVFTLPSLQSFVALHNCFHGSLPSEICNAQFIRTLECDGLASGDSCVNSDWNFAYQWFDTHRNHAIYSSRYIEGSIPTCILKLGNLEYLSMSGNGLDGTLPNVADATATKLKKISLSHNRLYGTIPTSVLNWIVNGQDTSGGLVLELSHNRLSGTLEHFPALQNLTSTSPQTDEGARVLSGDISSGESALKLKANRLSGPMHQDSILALASFGNLDILTGNYFACSASDPSQTNMHSSVMLPQNDPAAAYYYCGSKMLNISVISITVVLLVAIAVCGLMWFYHGKERKKDNFCDAFGVPQRSMAPHVDMISAIGPLVRLISPNDNTTMEVNETKKNDMVHAAMKDNLAYETVTTVPVRTEYTEDDVREQYHKVVTALTPTVTLLKTVHVIAWRVTGVAFLVMLPIYLTLKTSDTTSSNTQMTYEYGWVISIGFLTGYEPSICILLSYALAVIVANVTSFSFSANVDQTISEDMEKLSAPAAPSTEGLAPVAAPSTEGLAPVAAPSTEGLAPVAAPNLSWLSVCEWYKDPYKRHALMGSLFNCAIVLLVNGCYVYLSFEQSHSAYLILSLLALFAFKLIWNAKVVPWLIIFSKPVNNDVPGDKVVFFGALQSFLLVFNNVIGPAVATLAADGDCFQQILVPPNDISSQYVYAQRVMSLYEQRSVLQSVDVHVTTTFAPPFIYSYQCSSTLLTKYVPLFMILYGYMGIVIPLVHLIALYKLRRIETHTISSESTVYSMESQHAPLLAEQEVDPSGIVRTSSERPDGELERKWALVQRCGMLSGGVIPAALWPVGYVYGYEQGMTMGLHKKETSSTYPYSSGTDDRYKIRNNVCNMVAGLSVLLTFGLAYPPLAFLVSIYITTNSVIILLAIRLHIYEALGASWSSESPGQALSPRCNQQQCGSNCHRIAFERLTDVHRHVPCTMFHLTWSMFHLTLLTALFAAFFLFDISGGFTFPLWMIVESLIIVCIVFIQPMFVQRYVKK